MFRRSPEQGGDDVNVGESCGPWAFISFHEDFINSDKGL